MRRFTLAIVIAAAPAFGANRTATFTARARVVDSATVSAQAGAASIRLQTTTRAASLVQVGTALPVRASSEQTIAVQPRGDVVVTILY